MGFFQIVCQTGHHFLILINFTHLRLFHGLLWAYVFGEKWLLSTTRVELLVYLTSENIGVHRPLMFVRYSLKILMVDGKRTEVKAGRIIFHSFTGSLKGPNWQATRILFTFRPSVNCGLFTHTWQVELTMDAALSASWSCRVHRYRYMTSKTKAPHAAPHIRKLWAFLTTTNKSNQSCPIKYGQTSSIPH